MIPILGCFKRLFIYLVRRKLIIPTGFLHALIVGHLCIVLTLLFSVFYAVIEVSLIDLIWGVMVGIVIVFFLLVICGVVLVSSGRVEKGRFESTVIVCV